MKETVLSHQELFDLLEQKHDQFNRPSYIDSDPIQIPHSYTKREDIEISAFLTATIAWGNRTSIIKNAQRLMMLMDNCPFDFVINAQETDLKKLSHFVHRTFNGNDCVFAIRSLQNIYLNHGGLKTVFENGYSKNKSIAGSLSNVRKLILMTPLDGGREKHYANVNKNSSCKRLNMFLRWMVRNDNRGVDFGIWKQIPMSALHIPLDVHVGNVARTLGLLLRNQDDWKSVVLLTETLQQFCTNDPVKYDYSLFGLGVFEKFS